MKGEFLSLRALEPSDIDVLYRWENDPKNWTVSDTLAPFSKNVLKQYIDHAHLDIYTTKQVRFIIEENISRTAVGAIDLFDFDPLHLRAGIGILIDEKHRNKGYALDALILIENYCKQFLQLHQIFANIAEDNLLSISLFTKRGFLLVGLKKDWRKIQNQWKNELMFQKIID